MTAGRSRLLSWLAVALILAAQVALLRVEGRRWWCACGSPNLWTSDAHGPHNSQHLFDPYSFSHVTHGVLLCGFLWLVARRLSVAWRFCLTVAVEVAWEVAENSNAVIDRFRAGTAALGYRGDTVANSLGDVLSCTVGFWLARRLGLWRSIALIVVIEVGLLFWIRDNLVLDVLTLLHPVDAIGAWQAGH
ncbi:MAG TPA: DUF2585 family protein [Gemmataceae bacterium]|jgi:hypothetical protein|nr:DUF2585 family protein [Gemmataceae bacterium]